MYTVLNSKRRQYDEYLRKLKAAVFVLDDECAILDLQGGTLNDTEEEAKKKNEEKDQAHCDWVVWYWMSLFLGILLLIISSIWFIHM